MSESAIETRSIGLQICELRAEGDEDQPRRIIGYAAVFNSLSEEIFPGFRERIEPGAFTESLKEDDVRALVEHEPARLLGRTKSGTLKLREDKRGLWVEIEPADTSVGVDVVRSIERGDLDGMSIGFRTLTHRYEMEDGDEVRVLEKVKLRDVSIVAYPAYANTEAALRFRQEHCTQNLDLLKRKLRLAEQV